MSLFSEIINREDVKLLLSDVVNRECYNKLTVSLPLANNYFIDHHYALFLLMDAFSKFDIIIGDYSLFDEYFRYIKRTFKRMNTYQDISRGVNLAISKMVFKVLNINSAKSNTAKEKVLRYIYKKYIVEGYFYYGLSSSEKRDIEVSGIRKDGFILDSRLSDVNDVLRRYENKDIIRRVESSLTDNFVIACYYAFLGPIYLEELATSGIFKDKCYNSSCFYTKNVQVFRNNFSQYIKNKRMKSDEQALVINNLMDVWKEDDVSNSYGCVAFVKRSCLNRNYLKDIEAIINNSKDMELLEAMSMIMESRYASYDLDGDILASNIELLDIPNYNFIAGMTDGLDDVVIDELKVEFKDSDSNLNINRKISTSYGYASVFMLTGIILVSVGVILTVIVGSLGG